MASPTEDPPGASRPRRGMAGIVANPASGKDIRRIVAYSSVTGNAEKRAMIQRAALGLAEARVAAIRYMPDRNAMTEAALREVAGPLKAAGVELAPIRITRPTHAAGDTLMSAQALHALGCKAVVVIGGDGTHRSVAIGWRQAPMVAVSTGTNNAFPTMMEATLAGAAAGLVASGVVHLEEVARSAKVVIVDIEGERPDLGLIDAVLLRGSFVGARAITDPDTLRAAVLTRADPAAMGICGLGGMVEWCHRDEDHALSLVFDRDAAGVRFPLAPGLYARIGVESSERLALGEVVEWVGPGLIALDGERERTLREGQRARTRVERGGPYVIDPARTMVLAAARGAYDEPANMAKSPR